MDNEVTEFNVAFIGEKRLGKSSIVASMINSFDKLGSDFEIKEMDTSTADKMKEKLYVLGKAFESAKINGGYYIDNDNSASKEIEPYRFTVRTKIKNNKSSQHVCNLTFNDILGEVFSGDANGVSQEVQKDASEIIDKSEILIFAIDAVGLIERSNLGFASPNALTQIVFRSIKTQKDRIVLFVPVKCEKYYKDGSMEQLSQCIEQEYSVLINRFKAMNNCNIAIAPILTMGNMVFDHFERDENGRVINHPNTNRAKAWYKVVGNGNFEPKYCEQPMLHIFFLMQRDFSIEVNKEIKKRHPQAASTDIPNVYKFIAFRFGIWGAGALFLYKILKTVIANYKNKAFVEAIQENKSNINVCKPKISGDGFKLIHDPLGVLNLK